MTLFRSLCPPPPPPPPPRNVRHTLRVVGWNLLLVVAGLLLIGIAGEAYIRLRSPFLDCSPIPWRFVHGVGPLYEPNAELCFTNNVDFWTVQRANSLGFLDREPNDLARIAENCHITIIGDSFVDAREVDISDKLQVRLAAAAARDAPHLNVTTSAFGFSGTGQVNQLPFYDGYARHLSPNLVVLVWTTNDLEDNSAVLSGLLSGNDPWHLPRASALRDDDDLMAMSPADADWRDFGWSLSSRHRSGWGDQVVDRIIGVSRFMRWLTIKIEKQLPGPDMAQSFVLLQESLNRMPGYSSIFEGKTYLNYEQLWDAIGNDHNSLISREAWDAMEFGLEQFKRRADHDGAALMILTVYDSGGEGDHVFARLSRMAASLDIPVVSQYNYIANQGGRIEDARWNHNGHWNPVGHRWAAEAIWEHIRQEWDGECPSAVPQPDTDVDWISVGRHFHVPDGVAFAESFPVLNPDGYASVYRSVVSGSPVARSDWDIHLYDGGLTYVKEPCSAEDVEHRFFLHVVPDDQTVLMPDRRARGFDDLSFDFYDRGERFDGTCIVSADLPEYEIDYIRTGQFINGADSEDVETWSTHYNLASSEIIDTVREIRLSDRQPEIRSNFDIYLDDSRIIYVKDSCDADDRDTSFFLHVFPADENNLTDEREESGFDNLDFELMQKGGTHDGDCFAAVDLPEYKIDSIRTGQFVRGEGEVWETSIEFGK